MNHITFNKIRKKMSNNLKMTDSTRKKKKKKKNHTQPITPHFFRPLLPDFLTNFTIPESFVKHLQGEYYHKVEKIARLRDMREKIWEVKIGEDGKHLKDGWEEFCKEHNMEVGDFLVFGHLGNLVFDVVIFDPSTCERECPVIDDDDDPPNKVVKPSTSTNPTTTSKNGFAKLEKGSKKGRGGHNKVHSTAKGGFKPRGHPYFHAILRSYCLRWSGMPIPAQFARENGLAKRNCEMVVINEEAESCVLTLKHHRYKQGSAYIGSWRRFYDANGLNPGDPVVFELLASGKKPVMKFYKLS